MKKRIIFICIIMLLSSCNNKIITSTITEKIIDIGDGGLLSQEPCGPPCFYNIFPDITTTDQVLQKLRDLNIESYCSNYGELTKPGWRGITCGSIFSVGIKESSDYVEFVNYVPSMIITVGEVIDKYGDPNSIHISLMSRNDLPMRLAMGIYYDNLKMDIGFDEKEGNKYKIDNTTKIIVIRYSDNEFYNLLIKDNDQWHGYGDY